MRVPVASRWGSPWNGKREKVEGKLESIKSKVRSLDALDPAEVVAHPIRVEVELIRDIRDCCSEKLVGIGDTKHAKLRYKRVAGVWLLDTLVM